MFRIILLFQNFCWTIQVLKRVYERVECSSILFRNKIFILCFYLKMLNEKYVQFHLVSDSKKMSKFTNFSYWKVNYVDCLINDREISSSHFWVHPLLDIAQKWTESGCVSFENHPLWPNPCLSDRSARDHLTNLSEMMKRYKYTSKPSDGKAPFLSRSTGYMLKLCTLKF